MSSLSGNGSASNQPQNSDSNAWFCHECQWEGQPLRVPGPQCPRCNSEFLEEITPGDDDDPREYDVEDMPFPAGGGIVLDIAPGGGVNVRAMGGQGIGGAGVAGAPVGPGGALGALMQAFGLNPGGARAPAAAEAARRHDGDAPDPDEEGLEEDQEQRRERRAEGQVPLRNLATFLGEAFGAPPRHEADQARNNPYAEGGYGADEDEDDDEPAPRQPHIHIDARDPFAALAAAAAGGGQPGGAPLGSLLTLLNAFGLGAPMPGARGDYVFSEANFQQILNDLMEQAQGRAGPQPAPDEMIDELPKRSVDQAYLDDPKSSDCVICQDRYELEESITTLPCPTAHVFHTDCIVPWLKTSGTCSTCRFALVPQPGQEGAEGAENAERVPQQPPREDDAAAATDAADEQDVHAPLPGGWPDVERTRERSRGRDREQRSRQRDVEDLPPIDDLD